MLLRRNSDDDSPGSPIRSTNDREGAGVYGARGASIASAEQQDIVRLIVGQGMVLIVIGAGIGLALALAATRLLKSLLFGVSATDPLTFVSVVVALRYE